MLPDPCVAYAGFDLGLGWTPVSRRRAWALAAASDRNAAGVMDTDFALDRRKRPRLELCTDSTMSVDGTVEALPTLHDVALQRAAVGALLGTPPPAAALAERREEFRRRIQEEVRRFRLEQLAHERGFAAACGDF
mmetsp:Transcript_70870/g.153918  ORF Transcript_70870/g.153918 Transcript_70870/m.153918 type:complete len:135 (-) Transcript_70870:105-509(-)